MSDIIELKVDYVEQLKKLRDEHKIHIEAMWEEVKKFDDVWIEHQWHAYKSGNLIELHSDVATFEIEHHCDGIYKCKYNCKVDGKTLKFKPKINSLHGMMNFIVDRIVDFEDLEISY